VRVDQRVKEGEVVGELVDLVGDPIAMVRAPVTGVVLFVVTSPALKKDGLLLAIGAL
jgi:predicted deacylase